MFASCTGVPHTAVGNRLCDSLTQQDVCRELLSDLHSGRARCESPGERKPHSQSRLQLLGHLQLLLLVMRTPNDQVFT